MNYRINLKDGPVDTEGEFRTVLKMISNSLMCSTKMTIGEEKKHSQCFGFKEAPIALPLRTEWYAVITITATNGFNPIVDR